MSHPYSSNDVRLSDEERSAAMSALGRAFAEGRLTIDEYDKRCQCVGKSQRRTELAPLFADLPQTVHQRHNEEPLYSAREIAEAYQSGRRTKAGIASLTTIATLAGVPLLVGLIHPGFTVLLALIPAIFILLYMMKVGPKSWHVPSPRKLERERLRQARMAYAIQSAEQRASLEARQAELRAQRQQLAGQLTNDALGFAKQSLDRMRK